MRAIQIHINGVVQGVGFRPFVFKLAGDLGICGWVNNSSNGVDIHAEGDNVEEFFRRVVNERPLVAKIIEVNWAETTAAGYLDFRIAESASDGEANVLISPDLATCADCLQDMRETGNRRYRYAFTNCTNCGPRYSIIRSVPYDRERTTMASFDMCPACADEYRNPLDRRFHAQPVACSKCGPEVELWDACGHRLEGLGVWQLREGAVLAVKGLGGFHLVCDAHNPEAVKRLRARKERGNKPFAVMARDVAIARRYTNISQLELDLLGSPAAPIVILDRKPGLAAGLPVDIAPGIDTLGIMLPYTPLHYLLFDGGFDLLVMTSANLSGQPLIYKNEEALTGLPGIADYFLIHNREIYHPCDDSVIRVIGGSPVFFRRARGFVPLPLEIAGQRVCRPVLGVGADLKNAFCLADAQQAFSSQYIGDIDNYESYQRFDLEVQSFQAVVNIIPEVIVHDNHPEYQTTRYALTNSLPKISVQHHHAHLVSVMGEYGQREPTLGVICDGTGLGVDGRIWGFEFIWGNAGGFERKAHLQYLPLPGGDAAAKRPLRIAYAYVKSVLPAQAWEKTEPLWQGLSERERQILDKQLASGLQVFLTSSAGRLFDAVSALLGVCREVTYEGQAAIELEVLANQWLRKQGRAFRAEPYPIEIMAEQSETNRTISYITGRKITGEKDTRSEDSISRGENPDEFLVLRVEKLLDVIINDILNNCETGSIAYRFHLALAQAMVDTSQRLGVSEGPLVLNGGVFQNRLLTEIVLRMCTDRHIQVWRAQKLPPGDGGISFGQVLVANEVLESGQVSISGVCLE